MQSTDGSGRNPTPCPPPANAIDQLHVRVRISTGHQADDAAMPDSNTRQTSATEQAEAIMGAYHSITRNIESLKAKFPHFEYLDL